MSQIKQRLLSLILSAAICLTMAPTVAYAEEDPVKDSGSIRLGADWITGYDTGKGGTGYDYIYFGEWDDVEPEEDTALKWRVLHDQANNGEDGLFLLSETLQGEGETGNVVFYQTTDYGNGWQGSDAQEWCEGFFESSFTSSEQGAIQATDKDDAEYTSYMRDTFSKSDGILDDDMIFFLSTEEIEKSEYGFCADLDSNDSRVAYYNGHPSMWWLRSPCEDYPGRVGGVASFGQIGITQVTNRYAARPAFNLDLNSVLFTSAAEGGKPTGDSLQAIPAYDGNEWKLTLKDTDHIGFKAELVAGDETTVEPGDPVSINYSGAKAGENEHVSVLLAASDDDLLYYGHLASNRESGTAELTIPSDLEDGAYTLMVFSEQANGDKKTDYASDFVEILLTVDTTAPTLQQVGDAIRTSAEEAAVTFTSSEAGSYYYAVVDSGAGTPVIDLSGNGTDCDAGENTITLSGLESAGAKDIYIIVKDAAGNVSEPLCIEIPVYVAPNKLVSVTTPAPLLMCDKEVVEV